MNYRIEALRSSYDVRKYNPDDEVVQFTRSQRHGDVYRATYRFLLAGHWVRIVDDRTERLVSGPFDPRQGLPRPDTILPYPADWGEFDPAVASARLPKAACTGFYNRRKLNG